LGRIRDKERREMEFYLLDEIENITGWPRHRIIYNEKVRKFPRRYRSKVGKPRWKKTDIEKWMDEQVGVREQILHHYRRKGCVIIRDGGALAIYSPPGFNFNDGNARYHVKTLEDHDIPRLDFRNISIGQCKDGPRCIVCNEVRGWISEGIGD